VRLAFLSNDVLTMSNAIYSFAGTIIAGLSKLAEGGHPKDEATLTSLIEVGMRSSEKTIRSPLAVSPLLSPSMLSHLLA
jgi:hypothetical protein